MSKNIFNSIEKIIVDLAAIIDMPDAFQGKVSDIAKLLNDEDIDKLSEYYHKPPIKPQSLEGKYEGLGDWMYICQQVIFEIYYHSGPKAFDILKRVAFGEYDWTQITAIKMLCKHAYNGFKRDEIVDVICSHLDDLRYEALIPTLDYLSGVGVKSIKLKTSLESMISECIEDDDIIESLEFIQPLLTLFPEELEKYRDLLILVIKGEGQNKRNPMLDGAVLVVDSDGRETYDWGSYGPPPEDTHAIQAACVLYNLDSEDIEVKKYLKHWASNHSDISVRNQLNDFLEKT